jgi:hypothetical protein
MTTREVINRQAHAYVDPETGYVYDLRGRRGGFLLSVITCLLFLVLGALLVMRYFHIPVEAVTQPMLPTAQIVITTPRPVQQPVYQPPPAVIVYATPIPAAWPDDGGADLQQPAQEQVQPAQEQAVPAVAPLPAPGEEGFEESFEEPTCSAFIGYLPGHPCYGRTGQPPLPQPGEEGFVESFQ